MFEPVPPIKSPHTVGPHTHMGAKNFYKVIAY